MIWLSPKMLFSSGKDGHLIRNNIRTAATPQVCAFIVLKGNCALSISASDRTCCCCRWLESFQCSPFSLFLSLRVPLPHPPPPPPPPCIHACLPNHSFYGGISHCRWRRRIDHLVCVGGWTAACAISPKQPHPQQQQ
jgi:hypothetical protein